MKEHKGGCLCGAVRYDFSGEPLIVSLCHCTHCQKLGGGGFTVNLIIREQDLALKGEMTLFEDSGDSGHPVQRYFCSVCGTHILAKITATPGKMVLKSGTLDHPAAFRPKVEIYTSRAMEWLPPIPDTQRFAQGR